jgi:hypothetical protein
MIKEPATTAKRTRLPERVDAADSPGAEPAAGACFSSVDELVDADMPRLGADSEC